MKTDRLPSFLADMLLACSLLTRLPLPHLPEALFNHAARAVWAYPLVGFVIGGFGAIVASSGLAAGLPVSLVAGLLLGVFAITTGAMHEDGLADTADGFWGGHTSERRLEIMKDSQIGSYGTLALILVTGARWAAYASVLTLSLPAVIVTAVLSRAVLPAVMSTLPHARNSGLSHSVGRPSRAAASLSLVLGLGLVLMLCGALAIPALLASFFAAGLVGWLANRKIGGQTGDVLGAAQQLTELASLCAILIIAT